MRRPVLGRETMTFPEPPSVATQGPPMRSTAGPPRPLRRSDPHCENCFANRASRFGRVSDRSPGRPPVSKGNAPNRIFTVDGTRAGVGSGVEWQELNVDQRKVRRMLAFGDDGSQALVVLKMSLSDQLEPLVRDRK